MPVADSDVVEALLEDARPAATLHLADLEHPWLGLESFREETRAYFFGRDTEIAELHLRLRGHPLLVLYGRSGLGKTSILMAGLIPRLRAEERRPVLLRLRYEDPALDVCGQLVSAVFGWGDEQGGPVGLKPRPTKSLLWTERLAEKLNLPFPDDLPSRLWLRLHYRAEPPDITHLILDQFEEVFTLGARRAGTQDEVRDTLAILLQGTIPGPISRLIADHDSFLDHFDPDSVPVRIILALRDDYVYALNRWRRHLPALGQNNFELRALRGPAAFVAVFKPGELRCHYRGEVSEENKVETGMPPIVSEETARRIVRFIARKGEEVPLDEIEAVPPILSLLCRELNERRFAEPGVSPEMPAQQIAFSESDADVETIIKTFYERCLAGQPEGVRMFIEEELVGYSGARLAQDEKSILSCFEEGWEADGRRAPGFGDAAKARGCLDDLVNRRLLSSFGGGENPSYELTHDLLAAVVEKSRLTREALAQAERLRVEEVTQRRTQRRKQRLIAAFAGAGALAVALLATICGGYYAFIKEHTEHYREFAKRQGFPAGIGQISESEARKLPVSFVLFHKGIVRDGWKLRWKPAFRVLAVNGDLGLTTNRGVGTYLWNRELESKRAKVCQWEFDTTATGEIILDGALDRDGRMVYGLIYSPRGSSHESTRLARFVWPAEFPQLQRGSAAEYLEIHYDGAGYEDRIMYRDSRALAAAGPDGAFGHSMQHNGRGQLTRVLSLDAAGHNMIDNAGNCGMRLQYDEKGWLTEQESLGTDEKPKPLKDGWVIRKYQYDRFGRIRRETFHGVNGEPVPSKENGYHGWEAEYDEHGRQIAITYIDVNEKPTLLADGFATLKSTYDARGNMTRQSYLGVDGEPILHKDGYHGWEAQYDEIGNPMVLTYLDVNEKPTLLADGFATLKSTYDARGSMTGQSYDGVNGEPVVSHKDGYHGWKARYDEIANSIVLTYLNVDRKPTLLADGFAIMKSTYDSRGNKTRENYYGVNGEPVLSKKNGYHGWEAAYDERGNQTVKTYLGLDGNPVVPPAR